MPALSITQTHSKATNDTYVWLMYACPWNTFRARECKITQFTSIQHQHDVHDTVFHLDLHSMYHHIYRRYTQQPPLCNKNNKLNEYVLCPPNMRLRVHDI